MRFVAGIFLVLLAASAASAGFAGPRAKGGKMAVHGSYDKPTTLKAQESVIFPDGLKLTFTHVHWTSDREEGDKFSFEATRERAESVSIPLEGRAGNKEFEIGGTRYSIVDIDLAPGYTDSLATFRVSRVTKK